MLPVFRLSDSKNHERSVRKSRLELEPLEQRFLLTTLFSDTFSPQQPGWSFASPNAGFMGELNNNVNVSSVSLTVDSPSNDPNAVLQFDVLGFRSLDGTNCCTDVLTMTINGNLAFTGTWVYSQAHSQFFANPSGASYVPTIFEPSGDGFAYRVTVPHQLIQGINTYTWSYSPLQSFADEAWGLDDVVIEADVDQQECDDFFSSDAFSTSIFVEGQFSIEFMPPGGLSAAATACGVDHFNFLQTVYVDTDPYRPKRLVDGVLPPIPYFDPEFGGWLVFNIGDGDWTRPFPADNVVGYWDEPDQLGGSTFGDQILFFVDEPKFSPGNFARFLTNVIGVDANGENAELFGPIFDWQGASTGADVINVIRGGGDSNGAETEISLLGIRDVDTLPQEVRSLFGNLGIVVETSESVRVPIDIKPDSDTNPVTPTSRGKIPVAILSTAEFDVTAMVDVESITFGRIGDEDSVQRRGNGTVNCESEDVNEDGLSDLVCHFETRAAGFLLHDTGGNLKGSLIEGTPFNGLDAIRTVGGGNRFAAFAIPAQTRPLGDANFDGQFDQRDIVQVFRTGKYLTGIRANWSGGDWNGDSVFDQFDLVHALQSGEFVHSSPVNHLPGTKPVDTELDHIDLALIKEVPEELFVG